MSLTDKLNNESTNGERRLVSEGVIKDLRLHVPGENTNAGGESGNGNANVVVDLEDLLLVRGELGIGLGEKSRDLERKLGMEVAEEKRREDKIWYLYHATRVLKN